MIPAFTGFFYLKLLRHAHHLKRFVYSQSFKSKGVMEKSTIFALSTPPGISAVAIIRISGPATQNVFYRIGKIATLPKARKATLCKLKDPETDELLDKALILYFPAPNSFTGEDICELHIHGGAAVIKSVLKALQKLPNFRFAEPGEFTKRAFLANKLDLTEVEALSDLLHAETEWQQKQALRQMDGALCQLYNNWSDRLKQYLANVEAYIDFSEDQHLDGSILLSAKEDLNVLKNEVMVHLTDKRRGEKLRSGVGAVLVGKPNVGKSSLLNNLCKRDIAIVSSIAGTTRDIIESSFNLEGYLVNICDTAGIRETCNSIEEEGVRRAKERSNKADFLIFIMEARKAIEVSELYTGSVEDLKNYLLKEELGEQFLQNNNVINNDSNIILVLNKIDLLSSENLQKALQLESLQDSICAISCLDERGMQRFLNLFSNRIKETCCGHSGEEPVITQERHRKHVQNCFNYILLFEDTLDTDVAIAADYLRSAMNELGKITGKVGIEDILDVVFQSFCIGK